MAEDLLHQANLLRVGQQLARTPLLDDLGLHVVIHVLEGGGKSFRVPTVGVHRPLQQHSTKLHETPCEKRNGAYLRIRFNGYTQKTPICQAFETFFLW